MSLAADNVREVRASLMADIERSFRDVFLRDMYCAMTGCARQLDEPYATKLSAPGGPPIEYCIEAQDEATAAPRAAPRARL